MQQAWIPWTAWHWNYPAWSVSVETFFYLVFPFAALGLNLFRGKACLLGM
jgi:peptidoglycan/LPS O-acetylase OafA/YrhL